MAPEESSPKDLNLKSAPDSPAAEGQPSEKPHPEYEIDIFRDWCKACGICAAFCPKQCISLDAEGNPVVEKEGRCTGCRWCELHCPDFAISVRELLSSRTSEEEGSLSESPKVG